MIPAGFQVQKVRFKVGFSSTSLRIIAADGRSIKNIEIFLNSDPVKKSSTRKIKGEIINRRVTSKN